MAPINLSIIGHEFIFLHDELYCSDKCAIRAEDVDLVVVEGDIMAVHQGKTYEVNLCEGCYEMIILVLLDENKRLKKVCLLLPAFCTSCDQITSSEPSACEPLNTKCAECAEIRK